MQAKQSLNVLMGAVALSLLVPSGVARAERVEITATRLTVRSGPGTKHKRIGTAPRGRRYELLERKGAWVRIQFGKHKGWVYGSHTQKVTGRRRATSKRPATGGRTSSGKGTHRVIASRLNVRNKPSLKSKIRFRLLRGTDVSVVGTQGVWHRIQFRKKIGWVMGRYLTARAAPRPRPRRRVEKRRRPPPRRVRPRSRPRK